MPVLSDLLTHCLIAGAVGFFWGLSEIVGAFKNETGRALRTAGAWLLLLLNFAAAGLVFLFIASVIPGANTWITAILVGFAWPTIIRNTSIKLAQPLQSKKTAEAAALRFEQAYAAIQDLAYQLINNPLTRERTRLVIAAQRYDLAELEQMARLAVIAAPRSVQGGKTAEEYITEIVEQSREEPLKKALLAAFILNTFDRATLDDLTKGLGQRKEPTA